MRVRANAFRGDTRALVASQVEIRSRFEAHRDAKDPAEIERLLADGLDAADFLRTFVVQCVYLIYYNF